jgi:CRISPR-associated exonuclease Cas4
MDIKHTLLTSLRQLTKQHAKEILGNRSDYLGASEIGNCPRKVILEKINPPEHDLASLLRFERGHMAEEIIARVFTAAGFAHFERQVEILLDGDVPVKAHIDFVFTSDSQKIKSILEVKSTTTLPENPYGSWKSQLYIQMGVLAEKFPDHTIRGALIALDLAHGQVDFFNGYRPEEGIFAGLIKKAEATWSAYQAIRNGAEVELATAPDLLCGFCSHLTTCPRFAAEDIPHLASIVGELQELQQSERQLKEKITLRKQKILAIVQQKGPIKAGGCLLRQVTRNRQRIVIDRLEAFLADHGSSLAEFQEERPFSFLELRKARAA